MTTSGISAHGTLLQKGDGGTPETFATIAEVGDIDGPSLKSVMEDFTTHGSAGWVEKKPILSDGDQLKFPIHFVSTNATHDKTTGLVADRTNKTLRNFKVTFPDSSGFSFAAYVSEVKFKAPVKGKLTADVTLDVTGAISAL
jgi:hypothetical protein